MEVAARYSRHSPLQVGVGVRRDRHECRESTGREPSSPPVAGDHAAIRGSQPRRSHSARRSREFTPPSAAHRARRSRLTQARRSREITPPFAGKANPLTAAPSDRRR